LFYSARERVCYCGKEALATACVWLVGGAATPIWWWEKSATIESIEERGVLMC
jgi:hypothetical protein